MAKIIATRGDNIFILQTSQTKGYVINLDEAIVSEKMEIDAFLKFGYWEPYNGPVTADELLKIINEKNRSPGPGVQRKEFADEGNYP